MIRWLVVASLCVGPLRAAPVTDADWDPGLPYRAELTSPVTFQVDFRVVVTPPYHCRVLKVWIPLPPSDNAQQIADRELSSWPLAVEPRIASEPVYGNTFAYFEFDHPEGAQIITHRYRATVHELRWAIDPGRVTSVAAWPDGFEPYLRPVSGVVEDETFRATLASLVSQRSGEARDVYSVMDWIRRNLTYDHNQASLQADAAWAFANRRGHCSDYHGLCQTMTRALGYPSRVTYGINLFPKNSPSHCKIEVFLPPYGWVSFDVSETQRLVERIGRMANLDEARREQLAQAAVRRLTQGFRDNTWLLLTRGTNYELSPPAAAPVSVVRTAYVEADGQPLPEPDPANTEKREFAWMTAHTFTPDRPVTYPFADVATLAPWQEP